MNANVLKGEWTHAKGLIKAKWSKITDSDLDQISGRVEQLQGILQKRYGFKRDEADRKIDELLKSLH